MQEKPGVYYLNGNFLVFNAQDALALRKKRIVGQHIGCSPKNPHQVVTSGLPYHLNHYAAQIILENKLANFKRLVPHESVSIENNEHEFAKKLTKLREEAKSNFLERRTSERKKRKIDPSCVDRDQFDERKVRITALDELDSEMSALRSIEMDEEEVAASLDLHTGRMVVFRDLYQKGYYISLGIKFGSDFLVYRGDPVRYHAQYAVRLLETSDEHGRVDLSRTHHNELNALNRLSHTANKTPIFATIVPCRNESCIPCQVKYWTIKIREYFKFDSSPDILEVIEL